jgi:hypothetical protein
MKISTSVIVAALVSGAGAAHSSDGEFHSSGEMMISGMKKIVC